MLYMRKLRLRDSEDLHKAAQFPVASPGFNPFMWRFVLLMRS